VTTRVRYSHLSILLFARRTTQEWGEEGGGGATVSDYNFINGHHEFLQTENVGGLGNATGHVSFVDCFEIVVKLKK
jgi:hypothetical protein